MPGAVIVATARSPIGRAGKGSLREMRPDDLAVQMVWAALAQVPELGATRAPQTDRWLAGINKFQRRLEDHRALA